MEFSVKEVDFCKLEVSAEADAAKIKDKRAEVSLEFKDAAVGGFRPGKASMEMIKIKFRKEIDERLKVRLSEEAFYDIVNEQKIKPLGNPQFTSAEMTGGKFKCSFTLNKQPEFDLEKYKEFEIPKPPEQITAADLSEKIIQQVRVQNGTSVPFTDDDFIQTGDSVILDYQLSIDGEVKPEYNGVKEVVTVGKSPFLEFDNNILGMKSLEVREFDIIAPATAPEAVRGKTLHFAVTLAMGAKLSPHPLDDTLAQKISLKDLNELRENVTGLATSRIKNYETQHISEQVAKRLSEGHSFRLPDWIVTTEAKHMAIKAKMNWEEIQDKDKESLLKRAEDAIRLTLVLDKIREIEPETQLSDEEMSTILRGNVENLIREMNQKRDVDSVLKEMSSTGVLPMLIGKIRDEYTLEFLVKTCKITE